jgi:hypothetical protein
MFHIFNNFAVSATQYKDIVRTSYFGLQVPDVYPNISLLGLRDVHKKTYTK